MRLILPSIPYLIHLSYLGKLGWCYLATGIVPEGAMPVYNGPAPTKESDDYYDYMFIGWSPKVEQAQYKRTYTAQFAGVKKLFTVTWKDPWGGVLKIDENVEAGTYADYTGPIPTMPNNPHTGARNKFYNWWPNPNSIKILTDTTFTAQFREIYKITWRNEGVILKDEDVFKECFLFILILNQQGQEILNIFTPLKIGRQPLKQLKIATWNMKQLMIVFQILV